MLGFNRVGKLSSLDEPQSLTGLHRPLVVVVVVGVVVVVAVAVVVVVVLGCLRVEGPKVCGKSKSAIILQGAGELGHAGL